MYTATDIFAVYQRKKDVCLRKYSVRVFRLLRICSAALILCVSFPLAAKEEKKIAFGTGVILDSVKSGAIVEIAFPVLRRGNFELRNHVQINGYHMRDGEAHAYILGVTEKLSFGEKRTDDPSHIVRRYAFTFVTFGLCTISGGESKSFFAPPFFWETGGGAGADIFYSEKGCMYMEFGGGMNGLLPSGIRSFPELSMAGFARITIGSRHYF